jgi:hypothetical protein
MIEFTKYAKIKDLYCICYFGQNEDYLIQIKILKPIIEKKYKNLKIFIGCRDDKLSMFNNDEFLLKMSDLRSKRLDFGYIREIKFNGKDHPVESFLKESGIEHYAVPVQAVADHTDQCVVIAKGNYPTVSLDEQKINHLKRIAISEGYQPVVGEDVSNAGLVMGVESYGLFEAAARGIKTRLYPTGLGAKLYQSMFPSGEVLRFNNE